MKNKLKISEWPEGEDTRWPDPSPPASEPSIHMEYANEGDEFLDDSIRTVDQPLYEEDETFFRWPQ